MRMNPIDRNPDILEGVVKMSQHKKRVPDGPKLGLVILILAMVSLGLAGCSGDTPTQPTRGDSQNSTGGSHQ